MDIFEKTMCVCFISLCILCPLGLGIFAVATYKDGLAVKMEMARSCQSINTHEQN